MDVFSFSLSDWGSIASLVSIVISVYMTYKLKQIHAQHKSAISFNQAINEIKNIPYQVCYDSKNEQDILDMLAKAEVVLKILQAESKQMAESQTKKQCETLLKTIKTYKKNKPTML